MNDKRDPARPGRREWDERVVWIEKHLVPILVQEITVPLALKMEEYRSEQLRLTAAHQVRIDELVALRQSNTLQCAITAAVTAFVVAGVSWAVWH